MRLLAVYALAFGVLSAPLLVVDVPILIDYPDHLARVWLLSGLGQSMSYITDWKLLPNLAFEVVGTALAMVLPFQFISKMFVLGCMLLPVIGAVTIRHAIFGCVGYMPLFAGLFVYNYALYWGFTNYLFSLGCALNIFALWVSWRGSNDFLKAALFSFFAAGLILFHLFAFGVYALIVLLYEFDRRFMQGERSEGRWVRFQLVHFLPASLLWLLSVRNGATVETFYGSAENKFIALTSPMAFGQAAPIIFVGILVFVIVSLLSRGLSIHRRMCAPIIGMSVVSLLIPFSLMGSRFADIRLPIALSFVVVASLKAVSVSRGVRVFFAIFLVGWVATRAWTVAESWHQLDGQVREFRTAIGALPEKSRVLFVRTSMPSAFARIGTIPDLLLRREDLEYMHVPALLVLDNNVAVPHVLFTAWSPIASRPGSPPALEPSGSWFLRISDLLPCASKGPGLDRNGCATGKRSTSYPVDWPQHYDYVAVIDFGTNPSIEELPLQLIGHYSFFRVYRVDRPSVG